MADPSHPSSPSDPSGAVADSTSSDPNIIPPAESANFLTDRPVSTILADSPPTAATPSADSATDYTARVTTPADSPIATESANISSSPAPISVDSIEATSSAQPTESPPQSPADSVPSPTSLSSPVSPSEEPSIPSIPSIPSEPSTPSPSSEATSGGGIPVSLTPNEPSQVQPVVSEGASASQVPEEASQSAEIKPEPLEGTQNAPLADSEAPVPPKISFGDLVSDQPNPVSPPVSPQVPQSPQAPKTSFGDLVGIPPVEEPTITIEPIEAPMPVQPPPSPQSPLSPQPHVDTVLEAKADFSSKRQQALQVRRKKRDDHLAKILALVSQKGKIHNNDIVTLLRVSQSTATNYLHALVKDGKIKKEGKAKATIYLL